jgi:biopolymer transport protein ExbD
MRRRLPNLDEHLDLVPLIDCVFLLLLFFMLCGHLTVSERTEQITVPPARTAMNPRSEPPRVVLNLRRDGIAFAAEAWIAMDGPDGWQAVRHRLDAIWDRAGKGPDGATVVLELRADGDAPWRMVQQFQQVAADVIDPSTSLPRSGTSRPFRHIDFTVRSAASG